MELVYVFRMLVDGKVELIMAVQKDGTLISGRNETREDIHEELGTKLLTYNLGELT